MSETIKSEIDENSTAPESTECILPVNTEAPSLPETENAIPDENATAKNVEPSANSDMKEQTVDGPTKEISAPENAAPNKDISESTDVNEAAKDTSISNTSVAEQKEQPSVVAEVKETIGAGDTCTSKENVNGNVQKVDTEGVIADKAPLPIEKAQADNCIKGGGDDVIISKLKQEVQKTWEERKSYQKKLESTEAKLAALQASYDALLKGDGNEVMLRRMVDQLKGKLIQTSLQLEDRIRIVTNQEKQIRALNNQVSSLKEVESLTKSMLQIRNMEVKHLQTEIDDMKVQITNERERYNTMINKMDSAVKLNADLKKEYEIQLCLFRDLREKYEEKVTLLSEEKRALENNIQAASK